MVSRKTQVPPSLEAIAQEMFDNDVLCQQVKFSAETRGKTVDPVKFLGITEADRQFMIERGDFDG